MPGKVVIKSIKKPAGYENNPFFVAANGLSILFNLASGVAVMFVVLAVVDFFGSNFYTIDANRWDEWTALSSRWTTNDWFLAVVSGVIIGLAVVMIYALFSGVAAYTSYHISQNQRVSLSSAFHVAFENLWSFLWLQVIVTVKVLLWSLLFVIPGVIMAIRYSLASVAFFDERKDLKGNKAIKESLQLTKGAWLTTFASTTLLSILTFPLQLLSFIVPIGANAVLYRQFDKIGNKPKPEAHWLSWLTLILPVALVIFIIIVFIGFIFGVGLGTTAE